MVGHVAVSLGLKALSCANAQDLIVNDADELRRHEQAISFERAESEEVRKYSNVVECREMTGIFGHDGRITNGRPPEAGLYVRGNWGRPAKAGLYVRALKSAGGRGNTFAL